MWALALECELKRPPFEVAVGRGILASQRIECADQPDITIEVVEDQRDRLLAVLDVLWRGLVEFLEQRRDELVEQEIAHFSSECHFAIRGLPALTCARDDGSSERGDEPNDGDSVDYAAL